jgi:hypothetical protein
LRQKAEVLNVPAKTASEDAAAEELTTKTELDRLNALKVLADNILTKIKAARDLSKTRVTEKKVLKIMPNLSIPMLKQPM